MDGSAHRFLGAGVAGGLELGIFHPVDTVAKRLMNSQKNAQASNLREILFQDSAKMSSMQKVKSLFPGFGFGAVYKISQRVYKFGGQPIVKEMIMKRAQARQPTDAYYRTPTQATFNTNGVHVPASSSDSVTPSAPLSMSTKILCDGVAWA